VIYIRRSGSLNQPSNGCHKRQPRFCISPNEPDIPGANTLDDFFRKIRSPSPFCDGSIERADIDGKNRKTIIAQGDTHTPKQIILDRKGGKLYWCDREGMRVMRCNLDGTHLEMLVEAGRGGRRAMRKQQLLPSQASNIQARDMEPCR
jgi:hypothetical protein